LTNPQTQNTQRTTLTLPISQGHRTTSPIFKPPQRVEMDAIIAQIQAFAKTASGTGRKQLLDSLRTLQYEIETPDDTIWRLYGSVSEL
jgi:hypothetical protein